MKILPSVDLVLTDPPYNAKNIGPNHRKYSQGLMQLPAAEYIAFCKEWFRLASKLSDTIVFTPGIANTHNYPQPDWIIAWHKPAAVSFNRWGGYNAWEPIFGYGKAKQRIGQDYIKFNTLNSLKGLEKDHPCPKPVGLWEWLLEKFSKEGDTVLDPFIGSGTTAVVAQKRGRNFIGIDINNEYCGMSEQRLLQKALAI